MDKRADAKANITGHVVIGPCKHGALSKEYTAEALIDQMKKVTAGIRAKVEHPFRVIKRQFGFIKVRYKEA